MPDDHIGKFKISGDLCDRMVEWYESNKSKAVRGKLGGDGEVVTNEKKTMDIHVNFNDRLPIIEEYFWALDDCFQEYKKQYPWVDTLPKFQIDADFNIQKYERGGHFSKWHCERGYEPQNMRRCLVFMTYLNDVAENAGGRTEFMYQKVSFKPEKGRTLIWPAEWTHVHRGAHLLSGVKYIATGWYQVDPT